MTVRRHATRLVQSQCLKKNSVNFLLPNLSMVINRCAANQQQEQAQLCQKNPLKKK